MLVTYVLEVRGVEVLRGGFQPLAQNGQLGAVYTNCSSLETKRHIEDALYNFLFCISRTEHMCFTAARIYLDKYRQHKQLLLSLVRKASEILELSLLEKVDAAIIA